MYGSRQTGFVVLRHQLLPQLCLLTCSVTLYKSRMNALVYAVGKKRAAVRPCRPAHGRTRRMSPSAALAALRSSGVAVPAGAPEAGMYESRVRARMRCRGAGAALGGGAAPAAARACGAPPPAACACALAEPAKPD